MSPQPDPQAPSARKSVRAYAVSVLALVGAGLAVLGLAAGCSTQSTAPVTHIPPAESEPMAEDNAMQITKASFDDLPGWQADDQAAALPALLKSCTAMMRVPKIRPVGPDGIGGTHADWFPACEALVSLMDGQSSVDDGKARSFFRQYFNVWQIADEDGDAEGLFTGYYEPLLKASRVKGGAYQYPVHGRPADLVTVDLGHFLPEMKGKSVTGKVVGGRLTRYEERRDIARAGLDQRADVLVWADSAVDVFFLEIQGSGRAQLPDGTQIRLGYAAQNGHRYHAIGRTLIDMGAATRDEMSMPFIRTWLEENPEKARAVMDSNPSYVFFEEQEGDGPLGAQGVALTAGRSLAVDRFRLPYGAPIWLAADHPLAGQKPLNRLMVAQDTGGAIRGAVRGDVFWGFGEDAETAAGVMKSKGRFWLLLPRGVDPT